MSIFSSVFGSKNDSSGKSTTSNWTPEQQGIAKDLGNFLSNSGWQSGSPKFKGDMVAGMSDNEQAGQFLLKDLLGSGSPSQWSSAETALNKNMTGNAWDGSATNNLFNSSLNRINSTLLPSQSKDIVSGESTDALFKTIKDKALNEILPETQNAIAKNANLSGMYFSGKHAGEQFDASKDMNARLVEQLANMKYGDEMARRNLETQREARTYNTLDNLIGNTNTQQFSKGTTGEDRAFQSIPLLTALGSLNQDSDLSKINAANTYGSLPREIEQAGKDADYSEFIRTLPANNPMLQVLLSYLGKTGTSSTEHSGSSTTIGGKGGVELK